MWPGRWKACPRTVQAVSRIAGDAFGLLITSPQPVAATEQVIDAIRRSLAGLILGNDVEVDLSFRVGFSLAGPGERMHPEQIMEQADVALRRARKSRHAQVVQFRPGMNEDLVNRLGANCGYARHCTTTASRSSTNRSCR